MEVVIESVLPISSNIDKALTTNETYSTTRIGGTLQHCQSVFPLKSKFYTDENKSKTFHKCLKLIEYILRRYEKVAFQLLSSNEINPKTLYDVTNVGNRTLINSNDL